MMRGGPRGCPHRGSLRQRCKHPVWLLCYLEHCGRDCGYDPRFETSPRVLGYTHRFGIPQMGWIQKAVDLLDETSEIPPVPQSSVVGGVPKVDRHTSGSRNSIETRTIPAEMRSSGKS